MLLLRDSFLPLFHYFQINAAGASLLPESSDTFFSKVFHDPVQPHPQPHKNILPLHSYITSSVTDFSLKS
jgi:hypothetical protein